ncbi:phage tail assembly protein [Ferriphaselus sp. R-1]|uniref:phage tail assembly protein n=1 Tax=Ferriphaselus sp. R-1 TaxID=1485544 RepID=UPI00068DA5F4|nr:phage tail assembly protein [Ferriphaselus sp. R-1]
MAKLTLKYPLTFGKATVTELNFREHATAGDLLAFDVRGPNQQTITLIANLTGTDEALIKQLHVHDFRAADTIASELIKPESDEKKPSES